MSECSNSCEDIPSVSDPCCALKSPLDSRDWIFENLARSSNDSNSIPLEFTLPVGEVRDQGTRGTCAAFTVATIKEMSNKNSGRASPQLSPEFLYYHRNTKPAGGMYGRDVFQVMQRMGTPLEEDYPYLGEDNAAKKPSSDLYEKAKQHKIGNYARITTKDGLKKALYEVGACYLLLPLYNKSAEFWRKKSGEKCIGGHAVTVIGFTREGFLLQNSWGNKWNDTGCALYPFDDWHDGLECWVSLDSTTHDTSIRTKKTRSRSHVKTDSVTMLNLPNSTKKSPLANRRNSKSMSESASKSSSKTAKSQNCAIL